jgi:hypothetical protein
VVSLTYLIPLGRDGTVSQVLPSCSSLSADLFENKLLVGINKIAQYLSWLSPTPKKLRSIAARLRWQ